MKTPQPAISIPVDLTNPGQFFACCGLLELAGRLVPDAEGWFAEGCFHIAHAPADTLQRFLSCPVTPIAAIDSSENDEEDEPEDGQVSKTTPLLIGNPFCLRLDWWRDPMATTNAKLKTWSAGQKVTDLFIGPASMRNRLAEVVRRHPEDWLRTAVPIKTPKPFCYDSRLSRKNALDLGHLAVGDAVFSPAVDVLVHVAFQRFRPRMRRQWTCNRYCTWTVPLTVEVAALSAQGAVSDLIDMCFEFPIKPCDAKGRYKLFGHAQPVRRFYDPVA